MVNVTIMFRNDELSWLFTKRFRALNCFWGMKKIFSRPPKMNYQT